MVYQKEDLSIPSYIFGVISIVLALFTPIAGMIFGIIGLVQSKRQKTELSKKSKKLSIIGIILSIIMLIAVVIITYFFTLKNIQFPSI